MKTASAPFNNPDTDLILQSSDDVDFRVDKYLISMCLPVFRDMLKLPQPADEETTDAQGNPLVKMAETSTILDIVLRFCYPIHIIGSSPGFEKPFDIIPAVNAARKFEINGLEEVARKSVSLPGFATPFETFIISRRLGWSDEAEESAKKYLEDSFAPDYSPVSQYAHAADIVTLSNYFKLCHSSIHSLGNNFAWLAMWIEEHVEETLALSKWLERRFMYNPRDCDVTPRHSIQYATGKSPGIILTYILIPDWLVHEIQLIARSLVDRLCRKTVLDALPRLITTAMDNCNVQGTRGTVEAMQQFAELFADVIDRNINLVKLKLDD